MNVRLKVLHGSIKKRGKWQLTVPIKRSPFVIGQAEDCQMRCYGRSVCDQHCELRVEGDQVFIQDLGTLSGTFVNGERVEGVQQLAAGDRLQIGRLAFEVLIPEPAAAKQDDGFGEFVSDLLLQADAAERQERAREPEGRWYQVEATVEKDPFEGMTPKERRVAKARMKLPPKQAKPMKLPKKQILAETTDQAVVESLATYYQGMTVESLGWNVPQQ